MNHLLVFLFVLTITQGIFISRPKQPKVGKNESGRETNQATVQSGSDDRSRGPGDWDLPTAGRGGGRRRMDDGAEPGLNLDDEGGHDQMPVVPTTTEPSESSPYQQYGGTEQDYDYPYYEANDEDGGEIHDSTSAPTEGSGTTATTVSTLAPVTARSNLLVLSSSTTSTQEAASSDPSSPRPSYPKPMGSGDGSGAHTTSGDIQSFADRLARLEEELYEVTKKIDELSADFHQETNAMWGYFEELIELQGEHRLMGLSAQGTLVLLFVLGFTGCICWVLVSIAVGLDSLWHFMPSRDEYPDLSVTPVPEVDIDHEDAPPAYEEGVRPSEGSDGLRRNDASTDLEGEASGAAPLASPEPEVSPNHPIIRYLNRHPGQEMAVISPQIATHLRASGFRAQFKITADDLKDNYGNVLPARKDE